MKVFFFFLDDFYINKKKKKRKRSTASYCNCTKGKIKKEEKKKCLRICY